MHQVVRRRSGETLDVRTRRRAWHLLVSLDKAATSLDFKRRNVQASPVSSKTIGIRAQSCIRIDAGRGLL